MKTNMHFGASATIFQRAHYLRNHPTPAEEMLWEQLRKHQIKYRFRRQHPLSRYVVDFYCHQLKFVIELDGSVHSVEEQKLTDHEKDEALRDLGLHVLRLSNREVIEDMDDVLSKIYSTIKDLENLRFQSKSTLFK